MKNIKDKKTETPMVSIGVPVYNGEETLTAALDSLLAQSFSDFEIIVSDNASTDKTEEICLSFCKRDSRIIYVRQEKNIGAAKNFEFVLKKSQGRYFTWAAADDLRSSDFLEKNFIYLENNLDYVASTSPNKFEDKNETVSKLIEFSIEGDIEERLEKFLKNCWTSHGIYYSLIRTKTLKRYPHYGESFFAADWSIISFLLCQGQIKRTNSGLITLGNAGLSSGVNAWKTFRNNFFCWLAPLYKFSFHTFKFYTASSSKKRVSLALKLAKLNYSATKQQAISESYLLYKKILSKSTNRLKQKAKEGK